MVHFRESHEKLWVMDSWVTCFWEGCVATIMTVHESYRYDSWTWKKFRKMGQEPKSTIFHILAPAPPGDHSKWYEWLQFTGHIVNYIKSTSIWDQDIWWWRWRAIFHNFRISEFHHFSHLAPPPNVLIPDWSVFYIVYNMDCKLQLFILL